jgi:hypothetical protein
MKCNEAKALIKKLKKENYELMQRAKPEKIYNFDLLEIIVRPKNCKSIYESSCDIDLRVLGEPTINVPDVCIHKQILKPSMYFVKENERNFIKLIGEIIAHELVDIEGLKY